MDLHLFLGIRMQPAPVVPDRAMIDSGAGLVSVQDDTPSLVGCFPQVVLDAVTERVRSLMEVSQEAGLLEGMQRTLGNAFKLYKKTRPVASAESAARCKELDREGPHPLLARDIPGSGTVNLAAEIELQTYAEKLKAFRPAATVLEAEVAPARQGAGHAGAGQQFAAVKGVRGDKAALEMLRRKRAQHAPVIEDARRRRENRGAAELALTVGEELATSRYRDEEFFIPNQRTDRAVEEGYSLRDARADALNDAVLSVAYGDRDASGADGAPQRVGPKGKGGYTWDKKKRKYVRLQYNEKVTASGKRVIKNEAGAKVRVKDGDAGSMYKLWAKKTHRRVMATGEIETETAQQRAEEVGTAAGARQRFGRERARYAPPRPDLDEDKGQYGRNRERGGVKSAAVIRKEKAAKKRMEEHVAKKRTAKGKVRSKAAKKGMRGKGKAQGKVPVRSGGVKKGGKGGRGGGGGGKKGRR
ncbi:unnamed protein product [Pedinophyceae sp. YPF-701]|nr:unnamed protein product [Pedinophyceae sp. YPF-701]